VRVVTREIAGDKRTYTNDNLLHRHMRLIKLIYHVNSSFRKDIHVLTTPTTHKSSVLSVNQVDRRLIFSYDTYRICYSLV